MFDFVRTKYFYISIFSILFLFILSFATFVLVKPTKNDMLVPSTKEIEVAKNEPEFSWYTKIISAKFVGVESGEIILLDEEDNINFSYGSPFRGQEAPTSISWGGMPTIFYKIYLSSVKI